MKTSMWTRLAITALAGCVVAVFAVPASGESGDLTLRRDGSKAVPVVAQVDTESSATASSRGPERSGGLELRRDGSSAVPFVADVGPKPASSSEGFDWGDGAIGAGVGAAAVLLATAGASAARSRRREVRARATEAQAA